ncbi:MAG: hypothetical protein ACPHUL_00095 [Marinomonas gallaica]
MINFKYNRLGGIDCEKNGMPYTLTQAEIDELPANTEIAAFDSAAYESAVNASNALSALSEAKLSAYTFKGVSCSVKEADQNGWEVVNARINECLARGDEWRPIPFLMENGNVVILETHQEWDDFREAGWAAREDLMNQKAQLI